MVLYSQSRLRAFLVEHCILLFAPFAFILFSGELLKNPTDSFQTIDVIVTDKRSVQDCDKFHRDCYYVTITYLEQDIALLSHRKQIQSDQYQSIQVGDCTRGLYFQGGYTKSYYLASGFLFPFISCGNEAPIIPNLEKITSSVHSHYAMLLLTFISALVLSIFIPILILNLWKQKIKKLVCMPHSKYWAFKNGKNFMFDYWVRIYNEKQCLNFKLPHDVYEKLALSDTYQFIYLDGWLGNGPQLIQLIK